MNVVIRGMAWALVLQLGCSGENPESSQTGLTEGSASSTSTSTSSSTSSTTTLPEPEPPESLEVEDFERCPDGEIDYPCIATEDACICGPQCAEYGPAGAPGRCPLGEFYALCPDADDSYTCIISCTVDDDCPDAEMVCRPCPEILASQCAALGSWGGEQNPNAGPNMCAWPL